MVKSRLSGRLVGFHLMWGGWMLNYLSGHYGDYPILYCAFGQLASSLYLAWGLTALYVGVALVALGLISARMRIAAYGATIVVVIIELPRLMSYIFNSGGSCA